MPIYVYTCPECEIEIEEMRPFAEADAPMWCPVCGAECRRGLSLFAGVGGRAEPQARHPFGSADCTGQSGKAIHRTGCPGCGSAAPQMSAPSRNILSPGDNHEPTPNPRPHRAMTDPAFWAPAKPTLLKPHSAWANQRPARGGAGQRFRRRQRSTPNWCRAWRAMTAWSSP